MSALESLRLQEVHLTTQLVQALEDQERKRPTHEATVARKEETRVHGFAKGDRVWINNQVKKPSSWDNSVAWEETRYATVTEVDIKDKGRVIQVHFQTDNGVNTWRAPNNLRLLDSTR
jgi:hypothetical protein